MEDGLAWPRVAHGGRKHAEYYPISRIVILQQYLITTHTNISRNIVTLGITYQRMQIQTIHYF